MRLTKKQALETFKSVLKENQESYNLIIKDRTALREAWNNYTDSLCKDGMITERQYETWTNPY